MSALGAASSVLPTVESKGTQGPGNASNVQVVVRIRPPSSKETKQPGYTHCVSLESRSSTVRVENESAEKDFTFDYIADETVDQEEMLNRVGKPIADSYMRGYNCCLLAYGQTGAGKTYTMEGPSDDAKLQLDTSVLTSRGLIPRILEHIFQCIAQMKLQGLKSIDYRLKCSYIQIYNDKISDLLSLSTRTLKISGSPKEGHYVENAKEVEVKTAEAAYKEFKRGSTHRKVSTTAMNDESSRSHGVFILAMESSQGEGEVVKKCTRRLYMVDLAGSERQKKSQAEGIQLFEACSINQSLLTLGMVIRALIEKKAHVPHRDSKLTHLLKSALGGNSKCSLVANISPVKDHLEETLQTLHFAQEAKRLPNMATINVHQFKKKVPEIESLRAELAQAESDCTKARQVAQGAALALEHAKEHGQTLKEELLVVTKALREANGTLTLKATKQEELEVELWSVQMILKQCQADLDRQTRSSEETQEVTDGLRRENENLRSENKVLKATLELEKQQKQVALRKAFDDEILKMQDMEEIHRDKLKELVKINDELKEALREAQVQAQEAEKSYQLLQRAKEEVEEEVARLRSREDVQCQRTSRRRQAKQSDPLQDLDANSPAPPRKKQRKGRLLKEEDCLVSVPAIAAKMKGLKEAADEELTRAIYTFLYPSGPLHTLDEQIEAIGEFRGLGKKGSSEELEPKRRAKKVPVHQQESVLEFFNVDFTKKRTDQNFKLDALLKILQAPKEYIITRSN